MENNYNHKICVIGLGYVGLPLSILFSQKYDVIGYDINEERVDELNRFFDKTNEVQGKDLKKEIENGLIISNNVDEILKCNTYIITVPTPIYKNKLPNLDHLLSATKLIGSILKKGDIVIYESTVYPGCTEEECIPILEEQSNLKLNIDFYCGYSPERVNPGDKVNTIQNIVKVTSGSSYNASLVIDRLYSSVVKAGTHLASSIKVAEASKAIENAQRDLNISFVNELALMFDYMDIDTNEVIDAALTKWNFLDFRPGLVGGHCISVDPYYLTYKSKQLGYQPNVILSGRSVNNKMPSHIVNKLKRRCLREKLI